MQSAHSAPRVDHQRMTVVAAALSVLGVLVLPPVVAGLLDLAAPVDSSPDHVLTERAEVAARLPGAKLIGDSVVVFVNPDVFVPALRISQRVRPESVVGELVPLGVRGRLPMNPYLAPGGSAEVVEGLWPVDKVFSDLGPLVAGCVSGVADPPGACTAVLLTRHSDGYFRYPRTWGSSSFLDPGAAMEAGVYGGYDGAPGGQLVAGGLAGTDTTRIEVATEGGPPVPTITSTTVSPGDTVWWAVVSRPPLAATAYDAGGAVVGEVDLEGRSPLPERR